MAHSVDHFVVGALTPTFVTDVADHVADRIGATSFVYAPDLLSHSVLFLLIIFVSYISIHYILARSFYNVGCKRWMTKMTCWGGM